VTVSRAGAGGNSGTMGGMPRAAARCPQFSGRVASSTQAARYGPTRVASRPKPRSWSSRVLPTIQAWLQNRRPASTSPGSNPGT